MFDDCVAQQLRISVYRRFSAYGRQRDNNDDEVESKYAHQKSEKVDKKVKSTVGKEEDKASGDQGKGSWEGYDRVGGSNTEEDPAISRGMTRSKTYVIMEKAGKCDMAITRIMTNTKGQGQSRGGYGVASGSTKMQYT